MHQGSLLVPIFWVASTVTTLLPKATFTPSIQPYLVIVIGIRWSSHSGILVIGIRWSSHSGVYDLADEKLFTF